MFDMDGKIGSLAPSLIVRASQLLLFQVSNFIYEIKKVF